MTQIDHPLRDEALLKLALGAVLPDQRDMRCSTTLDALEVSAVDFMAIIAALEDLCRVELADQALARCVTLGDVIDCARAGPLDRDAHNPSDARGYGHGQGAPERYPRHRAPRARAAGLGPDEAEHRQAS